MSQPAKVLVVDDEPHVRAYVVMLVQSVLDGCEIVQADDEPSALAQYAAHRPDLVLLDINLIGGSGLNILAAIRRQSPDVVIVMLTGVNIRHTVEEAMAKGANGYILKEASHEEMADTLREILQERNDEDAKAVNP